MTLGRREAVVRSGTRAFHGLARVLCPVFGLRVTLTGSVPAGPVLLCPNHLSYIDVLVLASVADAVFVSRGDVARWPGIGPLSRLGGTVYIDRSRKRDAARAGSEAGDWLDRGFRVVVFLEGRAGTGETVLPFRSSLLEPACVRGLRCAAVSLAYSLPSETLGDGPDAPSVAREVAWADETPFGAHVLRLLGLKRIDVRVTIHPPRVGGDRKVLAAALERDCRSAASTLSDPSPGR
ncbi:MAG: 1-acyl-sn-glycerol-3-phosphate acyltransferase [Planctomycetes bacterium]|nr:1-acyl-sn-glycerol-3-phosphate acyltransferase [Planctomycetota bacterium]